MRVGYLQSEPVFGDKDLNLKRVAEYLDDTKADLVVLTELFATGYVFESRDELVGLAEDVNGPTFDFLKDLSNRMRMGIVAGIAELDGADCYNSCFLFSEGRVVARYRKIHLFDREKEMFTPGNLPFTVVDFKGAKLGLMICFDWIFPEVARILALRGAQLLCHPSNLVLPYCPQAMLTRAIENRVFAVTANRIGTEERAGLSLTFIGMSQIVSPRGEVLARAGKDEEGLTILDINLSEADNKMVTRRNHVIDDRRPEFYDDLCRTPVVRDPGDGAVPE
jgi:predicted amidohydrolase